jgi:hypothetical protein
MMASSPQGVLLPPELAGDDPWFAFLVDEVHRTLATLNATLLEHPTSSAARVALALLPYQLDELVSLRRSDNSPATFARTSDINVFDLMELAVVASRPLTAASPFRTYVAPTDLCLVAPHSWVFRILTNLVSNAIKHSSGDRVELFAEALRGKIVLNVRDNGRGISQDLIARFYASLIVSDTKAHSLGTLRGGRGVSTAMHLAKAMNGRIECISTREGTHWKVYLDPSPVQPFRVPTQLRDDLGWLNGVVHDMRQPLTHLSARFALDPRQSPTRMAVARLPYFFDEIITLINANLRPGEPTPSESFSLGDVLDAAALASVPIADGAAAPTVAETHLTVVAPKCWLFRIVTNLCCVAQQSGAGRSTVCARVDEGQVVIDIRPEAVDLGAAQPADPSVASPQVAVARCLARSLGGSLSGGPSPLVTDGFRVRLSIPVLSLPAFYVSDDSRGAALDGKTVVILDDNFDLAVNVAARFEELGARAVVFTNDLDMLAATSHMPAPPDLYVLDFMLDESSGGEHDRFVTRALGKLRRRRHISPIVILTDHPNHPGLREISPPLPVFTKLLSDMHFRALVGLLRGDIQSIEREPMVQMSGAPQSPSQPSPLASAVLN